MTDTSNCVGGLDNLTIDGVSYMVAGTATYGLSGDERTTEAGTDSVHGYSTTPVAGFVDLELRDSGSLDLSIFKKITNSTVILGLSNGKMIIARNLWGVGKPPEPDAATGKFKWRGESRDVQEG